MLLTYLFASVVGGLYIYIYLHVYVYMYVCMYVRVYVCMYVFTTQNFVVVINNDYYRY